MRRITLRNLTLQSGGYLDCEGLSDSVIQDIVFDGVTVSGKGEETCSHCVIETVGKNTPDPKCNKPK